MKPRNPAASERLLALIAVPDPFWFRPLLWVVYKLPGAALIQRLDHWQTRRALRLYRERKG